jgi:predicted RNase H-like HicB family nuclease
MEYRAVIKKSQNWWIGWLIDLPGVNAQEKTKDALLESLRIGRIYRIIRAVFPEEHR